MPTIFPSLIAADPLNLGTTIATLNPHCAGYHLDVMDNHFVPNLTWGPLFINAIARATQAKMWVHLMVDDPINWPDKLILPAGSIMTIHIETKNDLPRVIKKIREKKWIPSIAINPKTALDEATPILPLIDHVLLMSVDPGFSGQSFISSVADKIAPLAALRTEMDLSFLIGIDGGINFQNCAQLAALGVDHFAAASAIFDEKNIIEALIKLQTLTGEKKN